MSTFIIPNDCKGCGKCCIWPAMKHKSSMVISDKHKFPLKFNNGRCEHLTENNECNIYNKKRPQACTNFIKGSDGCLQSILENS